MPTTRSIFVIVWNVVSERLPRLKADTARARERLETDGEA